MSTLIIKSDISQPVAMIKRLGGNQKSYTSKILRAVGSKGASTVRKGFGRHLKKKSGLLAKEVKASLSRDKQSVSVYSKARKGGVRYGFVLAAGSPTRGIKGVDWLESEVYRFTQSQEFTQTVQKTLDKEVSRLVNK